VVENFADGEIIRELSSEAVALELGIGDHLRSIADLLDQVKSYRLALGRESWLGLKSLVNEAVARARALKIEQIDRLPLSSAAKEQLEEVTDKNVRRLADLSMRAEQMAKSGRIGEVQSSAGAIGNSLLRIGHYKNPGQYKNDLLEIGRNLHLLETERIYLDGGASIRRVLDKLSSLNMQLQTLELSTSPKFGQ